MPMTRDEYARMLLQKIKTLNERVWEERVPLPAITRWLENFQSAGDAEYSEEQIHALYLLSQFIYFGTREVRELLRALYRDRYRYPIIASLREQYGASTDAAALNALFDKELLRTRFLGIGSPAESGTHLLYYFRQENRLPKDVFVDLAGLFDRRLDDPGARFRDVSVQRLVFVDDVCGSGAQAREYSEHVLPTLRDVSARSGSSLTVEYLVLVAQTDALRGIASTTEFDRVDAVLELDASHKCLSPATRHFYAADPEHVTLAGARGLAVKYGSQLIPAHPLGWEAGELLLGFSHNVPDNTLPIMWFDEPTPPWEPIFRRYPKLNHT
jgi:hypothetical protein